MQMLIGGQWVDRDRTIPVTNPFSGEVIGQVPRSDLEDVDIALASALQAARRIQVGGVMINEVPTFRVDHMPYGGMKMSGFGREGLKYAVEEMTEIKLICFRT